MFRYHLEQIVNSISDFTGLLSIERVDNSIFKIAFSKKNVIFFDLTRGNSTIFKKEIYLKSKSFTAPFDTLLHKKSAKSFIEKFELLENSKVVKLSINCKSNYKKEIIHIYFEFIGRSSNVVVCDENNIIIEALRHTEFSMVGDEYELPEVKEFKEDIKTIENIDEFLKNEYKKKEEKLLASKKKQKSDAIKVKSKKLEKVLNSLEKEESLHKESDKLREWANLIFSSGMDMQSFAKSVEVFDFNDEIVKIVLPKNSNSIKIGANKLYKNSKRLKNKAKGIYKERDNLLNKIELLQTHIDMIENISSLDEFDLVFKKEKKQTNRNKDFDNIVNYYLDEWKIMVGKNESANTQLLKEARAKDWWFHLQSRTSSHVIVRGAKKDLPRNIIYFAAKLCVSFSVKGAGNYIVDFTQRRNVKVRDKSFVNYVDNSSVEISI